MATADDETLAPPVLANNVETLANVPAIIENGAAWFRSVGTPESPGTIVVTLTGDVLRPGVGEVAMGSRLRDVIEDVGGGVAPGRSIVGVLGGVSTAVLTADHLDVALSYEAMAEAGSALGSAQLPRHRQRRRRDRARGRRVALPRGRIVRTMHSVQAGRARDRERPLVPLPRGRDRGDARRDLQAPGDGGGRRRGATSAASTRPSSEACSPRSPMRSGRHLEPARQPSSRCSWPSSPRSTATPKSWTRRSRTSSLTGPTTTQTLLREDAGRARHRPSGAGGALVPVRRPVPGLRGQVVEPVLRGVGSQPLVSRAAVAADRRAAVGEVDRQAALVHRRARRRGRG